MAKASTWAQLRSDIDRGRTRTKVRVTDPAAAPLGTDEEAAGTPTSAEALQRARDYELAIGHAVDWAAADPDRTSPVVGLYVLFMLALAALVLGSFWLTSGT